MRTFTKDDARATRPLARTVLDGFVSPVGWDEEGQVSAVCVVDEAGRPFYVLPGGAADEVRGHLKRYVSVTGRVEKRGGMYYIRVRSVIEVPDPHRGSEPE
jgi:hypothetical protein